MDNKKRLFYDEKKIFAGLAIFVGVVAFPFLYRAALGKPAKRPTLERAAESQTDPVMKQMLQGRKDCLLPAEQMRGKHMDMLDTWRHSYVRDGLTTYRDKAGNPVYWPANADGSRRPMLKSLSKTCIGCHANKDKFCERCHNYAGAKPFCWDCHVLPGKGR